jgi:hypothetical protein
MDNTNTDKVVKTLEKNILSKAKKNLSDSKSSGRLQSSLKTSEKESKGGVEISIQMEDYGTYVDEGRKPGKGVPVDDLKKWIRQKGLTFNSQSKSKQTTEQKINSLAFLINRKIKKEGIEATDFLQDVLDELFPKFSDDYVNAYGDDTIDYVAEDLFE